MSRLGGSNLGAKVRNIMKFSFKDSFLQQSSWSGIGKTKKVRFQNYECTIEAIKKALTAKDNTTYEIEMHIKNWIRHANDRCCNK